MCSAIAFMCHVSKAAHECSSVINLQFNDESVSVYLSKWSAC